ncbi:hypothetical protein ACAE110713_29900 [Achromobacter aegrifaciens]
MPADSEIVVASPSTVDSTDESPPLPPPPPMDCAITAWEPSPKVATVEPLLRLTWVTHAPSPGGQALPPAPPLPPTAASKLNARDAPSPVGTATTRSLALELPPLPPPPPMVCARMPKESLGA